MPQPGPLGSAVNAEQPENVADSSTAHPSLMGGERLTPGLCTRPLDTRAPTEQQLRTLRAIIQFFCAHGYSPSNREIGEATGTTSSSLVRSRLFGLEKRGYIALPAWGGKRAICILRDADGHPVRARLVRC